MIIIATITLIFKGPIFDVFTDDNHENLNSGNKFDCIVHNGRECARLQKFNGQDIPPAIKIKLMKI